MGVVDGRLGGDFADHLRRWGLDVVEVPGWQTRGRATLRARVLIAHHTAGPAAGGDYPSMRVVRDGRAGLAGPLSQVGLGRSGKVYVIAAGKANHAGRGRWHGYDTNTEAVGIEAENDGRQQWPAEQLAAYDRLCAAVLAYLGQPASHLCAHREWAIPAGRKPDPHSISMDSMRDRVARLLRFGPDGPQPAATAAPAEEEDDLMRGLALVRRRGGEAIYLVDRGMSRRWISDGDRLANMARWLGLDPGRVEEWEPADVDDVPLVGAPAGNGEDGA